MQTQPRPLEFRTATPSDAEPLTYLMRRAKAHWRYPQAWLDAWRSDLTLTESYIQRHHVVIASEHGRAVGFYGLEFRESVAQLEHLWVEPAQMNRGVGRALLAQARQEARARSYSAIELVADPNAEAFYLRQGATRIGEVQGTILGHPRVLPRMRFNLA